MRAAVRHSSGEALKHLWKDPVYKEKRLQKLFAKMRIKPNRPEKRLRYLLEALFPGEYRYVGDGKVWINGKNPDFINVNGQKKIIELFGTYWHSKRCTGINNTEHRRQREAIFAKYGYRTLIVWQWELENIQRLKGKIKKFHEPDNRRAYE